jgi:hypothetical protein
MERWVAELSVKDFSSHSEHLPDLTIDLPILQHESGGEQKSA